MPRENRASTKYGFDRLPNEVDLKIPLTPFVKGGGKKEGMAVQPASKER
jgi:hypothetical protein